MPHSPSALCVRRGSVLVHVNDPAMLSATIAALDSPPQHPTSEHDHIAKAADILMQAVGRVAPEIRFLRDAAFLGRRALDSADHKFVQTLNSAYAMIRHLPGAELEKRAARIAETLAAALAERPCAADECAAASSSEDTHPVHLPPPGWHPSQLCDDRELRKSSVQPNRDGQAGAEPGHTPPSLAPEAGARFDSIERQIGMLAASYAGMAKFCADKLRRIDLFDATMLDKLKSRIDALSDELAAEKRDRNASEEQLDEYLRALDSGNPPSDHDPEDLENTIDEFDERLYALAGRVEKIETKVRAGEVFLKGAQDMADIHERGFEKFVDRFAYRIGDLEKRFKLLMSLREEQEEAKEATRPSPYAGPAISETSDKLQDLQISCSEVRSCTYEVPPCPLGCELEDGPIPSRDAVVCEWYGISDDERDDVSTQTLFSIPPQFQVLEVWPPFPAVVQILRTGNGSEGQAHFYAARHSAPQREASGRQEADLAERQFRSPGAGGHDASAARQQELIQVLLEDPSQALAVPLSWGSPALEDGVAHVLAAGQAHSHQVLAASSPGSWAFGASAASRPSTYNFCRELDHAQALSLASSAFGISAPFALTGRYSAACDRASAGPRLQGQDPPGRPLLEWLPPVVRQGDVFLGVQYARIRQGMMQVRALKIFFLAKLLQQRYPDILTGFLVERRGLDLYIVRKPQGPSRAKAPALPKATQMKRRRPRMGPQPPLSPSGPPHFGEWPIHSGVDPECPMAFCIRNGADWSELVGGSDSDAASSQARWPSECSSSAGVESPNQSCTGCDALEVCSEDPPSAPSARQPIQLDALVPRPTMPQMISESGGKVVLHFHFG